MNEQIKESRVNDFFKAAVPYQDLFMLGAASNLAECAFMDKHL